MLFQKLTQISIMATTDINNAPQQTDLFKFVIVRPPELISIENQSKHYISPNTGIISERMLEKFNESYDIILKNKKQIFELYRQLNSSNLLHEKIKSISELLKLEFDKIQILFDSELEKVQVSDRMEIDILSNDINQDERDKIPLKINILKSQLEKLGNFTLIDFLFLNLANSYTDKTHSYQSKNNYQKAQNLPVANSLPQRQTDNLEVDSALIKCLNFLSVLKGCNPNLFEYASKPRMSSSSCIFIRWKWLFCHNFLEQKTKPQYSDLHPSKELNIVDFKKIYEKEVKALHNALNVMPVLGDFHLIPENNNRNSIVRNIGTADLKVVKQKLIRYQTGEIAHIENVLKGELKERRHRQLDRTENIFTTSTETIEETTRDTQTTDRFELQKEVQKAVQEKMDIAAGVTVSGKGIVEYSAHADFAYSTAKQESEKTASTLAKEIIDKSVSRIQKTIREERSTKTIHEVEELNTHTLNNVGGTNKHIRGIYCWVDKVYLAELYNYGQRLMLEVSIPEPATFYRQLFEKKKEVPQSIIKSKPKPVNEYLGISEFTHEYVYPNVYKELAIQYQAEGIKPPPDKNKIISGNVIRLAPDANSAGTEFASKAFVPSVAKLDDKAMIVESGYKLTSGVINYSISCYKYATCHILISDKVIDTRLQSSELNNTDNNLGDKTVLVSGTFNMNSFSPPINLGNISSGTQVPFSVVSYDCFSYSVTFVGTCEVLESTKTQWQIETYEKIMAGYNKQMQAYKDSLNAHEIQTGIQIQGQNPEINREIEETELKRQCIEALLDNAIETKYGEFNGLKDVEPPATTTPRINFGNSVPENRTIQFFEQAIDWTNLTYLFYPYFWGKEKRWEILADTQDIDPIFTKFLQAGSARVSLPITKNYEFAIQHYLATGQIWSNSELPAIGNDMYLSIADEIRRQTDENYGEPKKEGDWEIVIPTTLVYLKEDDKLPDYGK